MKHNIVCLLFATLLGLGVISLADPSVDSATTAEAPAAVTTTTAPAASETATPAAQPTATETATPAAQPATTETTAPANAPDTSAWPKGDSATETTAPKNRADMPVSMNFERADIGGVLKFLSVASETPIVVDAEIKGTITIVCPKQVPLSHAYEVINSALRVRGYTMIGGLGSDIIRVVTLKKAVADKLVVQYGADVNAMKDGDEIITQIIPLQYVSAAKIREELKALVADDQGNMVASTSANALIVTDTAGNIRRIAQVVKELDKDTSDAVEVEIYTCKYASAASLLDAVSKVFQLKPATGQAQPNRRQEEGNGQPPPVVSTDGGLISMKGEIRIASDPRTNSIIISSARPKIDLVVDMLKKLDIDTTSEVKARTFQLQYADATTVAGQLNKIFEQPQGGVGSTVRMPWDYYGGGERGGQSSTSYAGLKRNVVVADVRTNSVVVTATEQNMREFEAMIAKLDAPKVLSEITRVFPLKYANAPDLATTMNNLFRGNTRRSGGFFDFFSSMSRTQDGSPLTQLRDITIVAEEKTNALLVTGPPQSFSMVEKMIADLDKRPVQVFIQVAIVDVTLDDTTKFGVEWSWNSSRPSGSHIVDQNVGTDFGLAAETQGLKYSVISGNLKALLHTLESRSNVKVYSTPTITTADNVEAKISIGRDQPFVTSETETSSGQFRRSVDFKNIAISLTVTPHVNETSDLIALDVYQTINELIGREVELGSPIIANREARTTVMVNDGQTIVIGGIMKENKQKETRGVPILSRIPLLGHLFKTDEWVNEKSELMVFLTPQILRDEESVNQVTRQQQETLSDQLPQTLLGAPESPKK